MPAAPDPFQLALGRLGANLSRLLERSRLPLTLHFGETCLEVAVADAEDREETEKILCAGLDSFYERVDNGGNSALWVDLGPKAGWYGILVKERRDDGKD